jgi:hypothetical protein
VQKTILLLAAFSIGLTAAMAAAQNTISVKSLQGCSLNQLVAPRFLGIRTNHTKGRIRVQRVVSGCLP